MKKYLYLVFLIACFSCDTSKCDDNIQNGKETGIDCGGKCIACPTCFDSIKNGNEEGIDCGGLCNPCFAVNVEKELFIRDVAIVDSEEAKTGNLSFGAMIERLAGNVNNVKPLLLSFLTTWDNSVSVNDIIIDPRPNNRPTIINPWKIADNGSVVSDTDWEINLDNAPFRLLSINSRFDLDNFAKNKVGEGRLTFGLTSGQNIFTLIFECDLKGDSEIKQIAWMKRWHQLSGMDQSSSEYLDTLVSIVKTFSASSNDLSQLRTNEVLSNGIWEFREFNINASNLFEEVTRKSSPDSDLNQSQLLLDYINTHGDEISESILREKFNGTSFLAGNALYNSAFKWKINNANNVQQGKLDTLTFISCVGCHGGLVPGTNFTHIKPRLEGQAAKVSGFLERDLLNRDTLITEALGVPFGVEEVQLKVLLDNQIELLSHTTKDSIQLMLNKFKGVKRTH